MSHNFCIFQKKKNQADALGSAFNGCVAQGSLNFSWLCFSLSEDNSFSPELLKGRGGERERAWELDCTMQH